MAEERKLPSMDAIFRSSLSGYFEKLSDPQVKDGDLVEHVMNLARSIEQAKHRRVTQVLSLVPSDRQDLVKFILGHKGKAEEIKKHLLSVLKGKNIEEMYLPK